MKISDGFELLVTAPDGVTRLRELILSLAVQGKLVPQDPKEEPASVLLRRILETRLAADGQFKREKVPQEIVEAAAFPLPDGWVQTRLGSIIELISGQHLGPNEYLDGPTGDLPYLTGPAEFGKYSPLPTRSTNVRRAVAIAGDILLTVKGSGVGKLNTVSHAEIAISRQLMAVRPILANAKFLLLALRSLNDLFQKKAVGIAIPGISRDDVMHAVIGLPSLAEQQRIASKVDELMRLCDKLESGGRLEAEQHTRLTTTLFGALSASQSAQALAENWARVAANFDLLLDRPEAIDALEHTILQLAMRGLLLSPGEERVLSQSVSDTESSGQSMEGRERSSGPYEIPSSWTWIRFGDLVQDLRYGTSVKCSYEIEGTPVLRIPNLKEGRVSTDDLKFGPLSTDEAVRLALVPGDLLIVRSNGSATLVGSAALVDEESQGFAFAGYLMRARLREDLALPQFVLLALETKEVRAQIEGPIRTTSGVKNINSTEVSRLEIPLPPLAVQSRVVVHVHALRSLCADLRAHLGEQQACHASLAAALVEQTAAAGLPRTHDSLGLAA